MTHHEEEDRSREGPTPWPFERQRYTVRFRESFPSTREALQRAVHHAFEVARGVGCYPGEAADLEISLREALANALIHGNVFEAGKRIHFRCYGAPGEGMLLLVRDEGEGFDPDSVPDPTGHDHVLDEHGRGILLMRSLMDYVEFRKGGREVVLYKCCPSQGGGN